MKMVKKKTKIQEKTEGINIESKYLFLTVLAGLLYYLAYFLKFPNSYNIVLGLIFLTVLITNFKSVKGINVFICLILYNLIALPLTIYLSKSGIGSKLILFAINFILVVFAIIGLRKLKKWAFYLTLVIISLSAISLIFFILTFINALSLGIQYVLVFADNVIALMVLILFFVYLIRSKRYFGIGGKNKNAK